MSLFSTSATLRPSHCLLVRRASGPMLLTGIPHLMSVARQSRHFGRTPANRRSREPALVTHSEGVAPTLQPDLALAGWWASPYLSWKGTSPREMHWTRSLQRGCSLRSCCRHGVERSGSLASDAKQRCPDIDARLVCRRGVGASCRDHEEVRPWRSNALHSEPSRLPERPMNKT